MTKRNQQKKCQDRMKMYKEDRAGKLISDRDIRRWIERQTDRVKFGKN